MQTTDHDRKTISPTFKERLLNRLRLTAKPTVSTIATAISTPGTYPITIAGAASNNYNITFTIGTLTIIKATQTITFVDLPAKTYGDVDFTPAATSSAGLLLSYSSSNPAVATVNAAGKIQIRSAGETVVTAFQPGNENYSSAISAIQTLTVNKASLTITVNNQTKTYSTANPVLTVSYDGFANNDTQDSLTTKPTITTTATAASASGMYPITVTGAASANYNITYVNGTLTIGQSSQMITFGALPAKTYGDADFTLNAISSSGLPVTYISTNPLVATVNADGAVHLLSAGTATITASQAGDANYTAAAAVTQMLTVNKALLTITANNQTKTYGSANPALTVSYNGFVNGNTLSALTTAPVIFTTATTSSNAGSYAVTASGADAANYNFIYVSGTLNINQASQTITFGTVPAKAYGDADFSLGAVSSSGLSVTYTSNNPGVLAVVSGKLHIVGTGSSTITANQAGNVNYLPAVAVNQDLQVILTLPSNNFTIGATGESCRGSSNGEINITAVNTQNYTATVVSAGFNSTYPFTGKLSIKNLPAGTYSICITIADYPAFKQCFEVTVTQPKDLAVYSLVNPTTAVLSLNLSGSSSYQITLNEKLYTTTQSTISLPLVAGKNSLKVVTANICQGIFEKTIELPLGITAYPNPFESLLSVSIANDQSSSAKAEVYNLQGKLVYSGKSSVRQGICSFDMANISSGIYVLKLILEHSETKIKIIKK
ncbi:MAG: T9SS type A sorting domain-containing protein [Sphingobacteriaceae bacterium]|nr:MAG: T9SS type A sorting domain-containing protein [Sphingobacteriaceae bacterium]